MKWTVLALLIAVVTTLVGCAATPSPAPARLPCASFVACDDIWAGYR